MMLYQCHHVLEPLCCEHGNEPPGYIKGGEILDYLNNY